MGVWELVLLKIFQLYKENLGSILHENWMMCSSFQLKHLIDVVIKRIGLDCGDRFKADSRQGVPWIYWSFFTGFFFTGIKEFQEKMTNILRVFLDSRKVKFHINGPLPLDSAFPRFTDFEVAHHYLQQVSWIKLIDILFRYCRVINGDLQIPGSPFQRNLSDLHSSNRGTTEIWFPREGIYFVWP